MAAKKSYHVIADPNGGWSVLKRDAERASRHFNTKADAVKWGQHVSQNQGTEFFVHRKDGTIERKDSYARDAYPSQARAPRRAVG